MSRRARQGHVVGDSSLFVVVVVVVVLLLLVVVVVVVPHQHKVFFYVSIKIRAATSLDQSINEEAKTNNDTNCRLNSHHGGKWWGTAGIYVAISYKRLVYCWCSSCWISSPDCAAS